jgi:hypothetical protein
LQPSKQFAADLYNLDSNSDLKILYTQSGRSLTPSITEWARLNTNFLRCFIQKLQGFTPEDFSPFWILNTRLYTILRNILEHVHHESVVVDDLEFLLIASRDNTTKNLEDKETRMKLLLQERRVDLLNHRVTFSQAPLEAGLQQTVYASIPGDNTDRNRAKAAKRKARTDQLRDLPGFMSRTAKRQARLSNILVSRGQLATTAQKPGTSISKPVVNSPIPSTSGVSRPIASTSGSNRSTPSTSGPKKLSPFDLRYRLVGQSENAKSKIVSFSLHTKRYDGPKYGKKIQKSDLRNKLPRD